ncbi:MAG: Uma2 family endonuclease [Pirellulaceae bacterium]
MSNVETTHSDGSLSDVPVTLPVTVEQYADLVAHGHFENAKGKIELINGRIVQVNPQGPQHADPIDIFSEWSYQQVQQAFRIRIEKPLVLPSSSSTPEPDVAWVKRQSYAQRHPGPEDILLVVEASVSSVAYDTGEKCDVYAQAGVPEYWQINVPRRQIRVHRDPDGEAFRTITTHGVDESISPVCLPEATLRIGTLFDEG